MIATNSWTAMLRYSRLWYGDEDMMFTSSLTSNNWLPAAFEGLLRVEPGRRESIYSSVAIGIRVAVKR